MASNGQGWEIRWSNSRDRMYFYNAEKSESRWEAPEGLTADDIRALPGHELLERAASGAGAVPASSSSGEPKRIQASHLLIKHNESRRPASWRSDHITRSKSEATDILTAHERTIRGSDSLAKKFAEIASSESDCSSHSNGGDLGPFQRGQMQKPFEDAAFALKVGEMSPITSTDSGVHLILRTA